MQKPASTLPLRRPSGCSRQSPLPGRLEIVAVLVLTGLGAAASDALEVTPLASPIGSTDRLEVRVQNEPTNFEPQTVWVPFSFVATNLETGAEIPFCNLPYPLELWPGQSAEISFCNAYESFPIGDYELSVEYETFAVVDTAVCHFTVAEPVAVRVGSFGLLKTVIRNE